MGKKSNSLQFELIKRVLPQIDNNRTGKAYKKRIKNFAEWAKENGYKKPESITRDVIQEYEKALESDPKGYSPSTIHAYLSPVCSAAGVPMDKIRKPKRTAGSITRGRDHDVEGNPAEQNLQGRKQASDPKYARLVALQEVLGIRRSELGHLVGADLVNMGRSWYVRVRRGKGGKEQLQYILPKDVETVRQVFAGIGPEQRVFSKKEMNNKINLHGMRAKHGKNCYHYYADMIAKNPAAADKLRALLLHRWEKGHEKLKNDNPKAWTIQRSRFISDMDDRPYQLRGDNLRKAKTLGLPEEYNRLALMCVSVLHLSHWRLDVTATNYLIQ